MCFAALVAVTSLSGCAALKENWQAKNGKKIFAKSDPVAESVAALKPGETAEVKPGVTVTLRKKYTALTGDSCMRLDVSKEPEALPEKDEPAPNGAPTPLAKPGRVYASGITHKILCKHDGAWRYYPAFGSVNGAAIDE